MITTLELLKTAVSAPASSAPFDAENEITDNIHGMSFMAKLNYFVKELNRFKDVGTPLLRLMISFTLLCNAYSKGVDEDKLRECIDDVYKYGRIYIPEEFEDPDDLTDQELTEGVTEFLEDILQTPEGIAEVDKNFGAGTATGLMNAIHSYKGFVIYEDDDEEDASPPNTNND